MAKLAQLPTANSRVAVKARAPSPLALGHAALELGYAGDQDLFGLSNTIRAASTRQVLGGVGSLQMWTRGVFSRLMALAPSTPAFLWI